MQCSACRCVTVRTLQMTITKKSYNVRFRKDNIAAALFPAQMIISKRLIKAKKLESQSFSCIFSLSRPLGRLSEIVAMSACLSVCLCVP